MMVRVRLLGAPHIAHNAEESQPRGRKSWALLARLALSSRPLARTELSRMLFSEAADPARALRWSLADLRRSLGRSDLLKGDPLTLVADPQLEIDVLCIDSGDAPHADLDGELLAGMEPEGCPEFSVWLVTERHGLRARLENTLHDAAHRRAATGDWQGALVLAGRAVRLNPLDEPLQELLVRCLAMTGDRRSARAQVERCKELFEKELGTEPSIALRSAAGASPQLPGSSPAPSRSAIESLLEAGRSAVDAGAADAGIATLRRALAGAKQVADSALGARCATGLGGALVHGIRGRHEEGATLLYEAVVMARRSGQKALAADALRELAYIDVQAGRRRQALRLLDEAADLAVGDDSTMSAILGVRGMSLSDHGRYSAAEETLHESVDRAILCDKHRQAAWSLSILARVHAMRYEHGLATQYLERSLELVQRERWTAFAPFPQALMAEVQMREGRTPGSEIAESLEGTFALACQVGDPCWEGMSARVMALVASRAGDSDGAQRWIDEAETRCGRGVNGYAWMRAYVLDGRCELMIHEERMQEATVAAGRLAELSARTEQYEHLARALAYQGKAGNAIALIQARAVANEVDNEALGSWLSAIES
ncbi:MAG: SARP family transcriptional regulator [Deltaproteobacteria bacterium]|nr:SARP family transcriptional regulator [Deltaproteobacteria bacterium]